MAALKLTSIGNSVGVILPKELLVKLGVQKGDTLLQSRRLTVCGSRSATRTTRRR